MPQAVPCKRCQTDKHLKWKTIQEERWWIVCEGCGSYSQPKLSRTEAGEQWNRENGSA